MAAGIKVYGIREFILNLKALGADVERASKRAIWEAGAFLEKELKQELSKTGTGKIWPKTGIKKKGGRYGFHTASAPGEPPAPDDSRLKASITHNVTDKPGDELPDPGGSKNEIRGHVGTNVEYGAHLEFGVPFMHPFGNVNIVSSIEPRPWMYVTISRNANEVSEIIKRSLEAAVEKARKQGTQLSFPFMGS